MVELDTAMFICKVLIGLALIVKVVLGMIQDKRKKISVDIETTPHSGESQIFFLK